MERWLRSNRAVASSLVIVVLLSVTSIHTAYADVCPKFTCGQGNFLYGKFTDRVDPLEEPEPLVEAYFTGGQMYNYDSYNISDETIADANTDCYKFCSGWNAKRKPGEVKAKYWMFEETCLEATGGICTCFASTQCNGPNSYSSKWMEAGRRVNGDYEVPANFTAGELCEPGHKGDPHFSGADGSHFDFSGKPNRNYAIVSDLHLQVNGYFGGRYTAWGSRLKALTWIRDVSVMHGHHTVVLEARKGAEFDYNEGYLARVLVDGKPVQVKAPGTSLTLWEGATLTWVYARQQNGDDYVDVFDLAVDGVATIRLTLRPEVETWRTPKDGTVHFGLEVLDAHFSPAVHGVLGQTYRQDFAGRLAEQKLEWSDLLQVMAVPGDNAEGFLYGGVDDYQVSGLLKSDCKMCTFTRAENVDKETTIALAMMGGVSGGGISATTPRKALKPLAVASGDASS
ncbi:unnamed protein product [Closterium sp. Naga37s-1]|nr:unnamed protein product [Closterium sp. Naga37s-1]